MNTSHSPDRRKFPRHNISVPMTFVLPGGKAEEPLHATSVNISLNGISCIVNRYIPPFEKLLITLLHPAHHGKPNEIVLQGEGVVVRIEPEQQEPGRTEYAVAFYFPSLSKDQQQALKDLIEDHAEIVA